MTQADLDTVPASGEVQEDAAPSVLTGIEPLDERAGGLTSGGSYLLVGQPGPAKMVAALQFIYTGLLQGERVALITGADLDGILEAAEAWGLPLRDSWLDGRLTILGFRDDFELRAARSVVPEEVVEELDREVGGEVARIAVDPGALFLQGGSKTLLGGAYLRWARNHPATVCTTFSVDEEGDHLPAAADWLQHATTGRILVERRSGDIYQMSVIRAIPGPAERNTPATVELRPGEGLTPPRSFPSQRGEDRGAVDPNRVLLVLLGADGYGDLRGWAEATFQTVTLDDPLDAVTAVQGDQGYGAVLVSAPRGEVGAALQVCRALRPLTRAAIVFASDDAIRGSDRIQLLEAGADECLTGGLDFRELGLRMRQAIASGSRAPAQNLPVGPDAPVGGVVEPRAFRDELKRRSAAPGLSVFSLVVLTGDEAEIQALNRVAADEIRSEEGDILTLADGQLQILLQGARGSQTRPFLDRLASRARSESGVESLDPQVLSHPGDLARMEELQEEAGGDTG